MIKSISQILIIISSRDDYVLLYFAETKTIIKSKYEQIDDQVTILLGQKLNYQKRKDQQRSYDVTNSFAGRYASLTIWRGQISEEQIEKMANCEEIISRGIVLDWDIGKYNGNDVDVLEYQSSKL